MIVNNCNYKPSTKIKYKAPEKEPKDIFTPSVKEKEWTFLVYLDATKSHDKLAFYKLRDMERVGSDENVNIVAEITRNKHFMDRITKDWEGTRRYYVTQETHKNLPHVAHLYLPWHTGDIKSPVVENLSFQDPGKTKTLEQFLEWGMKNYPAKNYAVIISSHGSGIEGVMGNNEQFLSIPELGEVTKKVEASTGKKINLMVLDESNSASLEIATELSGSVDYLVGSEGLMKGTKIPLGRSIKTVKQGVTEEGIVDPKEAGEVFLYESGRRKYASVFTPSVSVLDLNNTEDINKILKELTESLNNHPDKKLLRNLVKKSQQFHNNKGRKEMLDLRDFARVLSQEDKISNQGIGEIAKKLDNELDKMVISNFYEGKQIENAGGIAIYAPTKKNNQTKKISKDVYSALKLNSETDWDNFIQYMAKDRKLINFLSSLGVRDKELKILDRFLGLTRQVFKLQVAIGSIRMGLSGLDHMVKGNLAGTVGTAVALGLGGSEISYGLKNTYLYLTNEEAKDKQELTDSLFHTMEGLAITSTMTLPAKILGEIGQNVVQTIGAAGGVYHTFKGVYNVFSAIKDKELINRDEKIIDNALDGLRGIAVVAVTMGIILGLGAGITTSAGIAAAAIPAAKTIYNLLSNIKDLKDEDIDMKTFCEKLAEIPLLSSSKPRHYISPTVKGVIEGIGTI